jgi:hypothetical protein
LKKICHPSLLSKKYFVLSNLLAKVSLYVFFSSLQVTKNGIWKALLPSIRSRQVGPKYGEKNLLWKLRAASSSYELPALPPPSPHVATPAKVSTAS